MNKDEIIARRLSARLAADMERALFGGPVRKQPETALRVRGNTFEVVQLDDDGNIIEPPPVCWRCARGFFLCPEHMALVS